MITVKLPGELRREMGEAIANVAMRGDVGGWEAIGDRLRDLEPLDAYQQDLGMFVAAMKDEMPQVFGALWLGVLLCRAVRNEIEFAKSKAAEN